MKLKILKDSTLANRRPWIENFSFTKDEIFETNDAHLSNRLIELAFAKEIAEKGSSSKKMKEDKLKNKKMDIDNNK